MVIELPQGYYLNNFLDLITHVHSLYEDILSPFENQFVTKFLALPSQAQLLYVRMLTRKGNFFRANKLNYEEIPDKSIAIKLLEQRGFISTSLPNELTPLLPLFNKQEWLLIVKQRLGDAAGKLKHLPRQDLNDKLLEAFDTPPTLDEEIIEVLHPELFDIFLLLYFGNTHQDLSEYVLRDLGLYQYESYKIDRTNRLFQTRKQLEKHIQLAQLTDGLDLVLEDSAAEIVAFYNKLPPQSKQDEVFNRRLNRAKFSLARQLERLKSLNEAKRIYQDCPTPESRERLARVLIALEEVDSGLTLCKKILEAPLNEEERIFALEFGARVAKKYKLNWEAVEKQSPPTETIYLPYHEHVEVASSEYYSNLTENSDCFYVENGLFNSLFGLTYWDVIYQSFRGAFTHPFQIRPHDLYEYTFIQNRQSKFNEANIRLSNKRNYFEYLKKIYSLKNGIASPFIYWDLINEQLLERSIEHIPLAHLSYIFQRIWSDLKANRAGFPDLILFTKDSYELIEVKGPGDRLQKNQLRWMNFFHQHAIPHKVVNVEWQ